MYILILITIALIAYIFYLKSKFNEEAQSIVEESERLQSGYFETLEELSRLAKVKHELEVTVSALRESKVDVSSMVDRESYRNALSELEATSEAYRELKEKHDKMVSNTKSKEVRLGAIAETLTPFLQGFPYDAKALRPLGNPIDYIAFEEDEIVFIEVKSGNAKLTPKQNKIKDIIETGKVRFEIHRIDESGLSIK